MALAPQPGRKQAPAGKLPLNGGLRASGQKESPPRRAVVLAGLISAVGLAHTFALNVSFVVENNEFANGPSAAMAVVGRGQQDYARSR